MLDSYFSQDTSGLIDEIIIIDDASTDSRIELVIIDFMVSCTTKVVTMRNKTNKGFATSVNTASSSAKGDIFIVCNSDIIFKEMALAKLLATFDNKMVGAAGCVHLRYDDKSVDHAGVVVSRDGKVIHNKSVTLDLSVWAFSGALFAVRARIFRSLEGFDEQFVNGGEDIDLCIRIRKSGFILDVVNDCIIEHHVGASRGINVSRDEANSFLLYQKWEEDIRKSCATSWANEFQCVSQIENVMGFCLENYRDFNSVVSFLSRNYVAREIDRWRRMFCGHKMAVKLLYYNKNSTKNMHTIDLGFESSETIFNFYVCGICKAGKINVYLLFDGLTAKNFHSTVNNFNFGVVNPISIEGGRHIAEIKICGERYDFKVTHIVVNDIVVFPPRRIHNLYSFLFKLLFYKFRRRKSGSGFMDWIWQKR